MHPTPGDPARPEKRARWFEAMVEKVKDYAIFLTDEEGAILTWNKAAEAMKGYAPSEAIGAFLGMLYTDEDQQKGAPQHNLKAAAEHGTFQDEAWRRRKDGLSWTALNR